MGNQISEGRDDISNPSLTTTKNMERRLNPSLLQEFENLDKDADARKSAMKAIKSCVKDLDSMEIPLFIARVSEAKYVGSSFREFTISLFKVLAQVHGPKIAPHIDEIMSTVIKTLASADSSFLLHLACAEVVAELAHYIIDPTMPEDQKRNSFHSLCEPLSASLLGNHENLSAGSALCVRALVDSDNWRLATDYLVDELCKRVAASITQLRQPSSHSSLVMTLAKHNSLIVEAHASLLINLGFRILKVGVSEGDYDKRLNVIKMIGSFVECLDPKSLFSEIELIIEEMEKCLSDQISYVGRAAFEALEAARWIKMQKNSKLDNDIGGPAIGSNSDCKGGNNGSKNLSGGSGDQLDAGATSLESQTVSSTTTTMERRLIHKLRLELENLEKDDDSRRYAMTAIKAFVIFLDSTEISFFIARISETKDIGSIDREFTVSVYEVLARARGPEIAPFTEKIMSNIINTLASGDGSFALRIACSEVVLAIARYAIDPTTPENKKTHIVHSLCKPLSDSLSGNPDSLSSGSAFCLRALVDSDNWRFVSNDMVNEVCKEIAASVENLSQSSCHMALTTALAEHNSLIVEGYARLLIQSGLRILKVRVSEGDSQKRLYTIRMVNALMKCLDPRSLFSDIDLIVDEMEGYQSDQMVHVSGAAFEALQTARTIAIEKDSATGLNFDCGGGNSGRKNGEVVGISLKDELLSEVIHPSGIDSDELLNREDDERLNGEVVVLSLKDELLFEVIRPSDIDSDELLNGEIGELIHSRQDDDPSYESKAKAVPSSQNSIENQSLFSCISLLFGIIATLLSIVVTLFGIVVTLFVVYVFAVYVYLLWISDHGEGYNLVPT